jgi:hypothetical protein
VRVAPDERERFSACVRGEHGRPRAGGGDARYGEPAAELDDAQAAERHAVELARERHAAAPKDGPVRRDRRPFDRARVRQRGGLLRLQQAELTARQLDRLADELFARYLGEWRRRSAFERPSRAYITSLPR